MNKVTSKTGRRVCVVQASDEVDELRWFHIHRYFEAGLLSEVPTELPDDPTVEHSTYFAVYGKDGSIEACTRLIHPSAGIPLLDYHELHPKAQVRLLENADRIGEISSLAVARTAGHHRCLGLLARELFRFGLRQQECTALLCSIEPSLLRILEQVLGVPVEILGPKIPQYGQFAGETVPVLIDTVRYLTEARWRDHRNWEFFTSDLVIDLTDSGADSLVA